VLPLAAGAALVAATAPPWIALVPAAAAAFTLWFFRDPERHGPGTPGAILSPADGRILRASPAGVSIFMNVFDVHVCRSPVGGTVESVRHVSGRVLAAFKHAAPEQNERVSIVVADAGRAVTFVLVAGLVARRIVCKVVEGRRLAAGERVGLIRFGSRVDVALPPGCRVLVQVGQRVRAGETPLAQEPATPGEPGAFPIY
jgi:phosphatidylserine decarboxylase